MKTKLIAAAIGSMALSQIVGAQGLFTGAPGDDIFGNSLIGNVQVVNVSADTTPDSDALSPDVSVDSVSSDDSSFVSISANDDTGMATPLSPAMIDASPEAAPAPLARTYAADYQSASDSTVNDTSDLAANGGWLNFGIISAPDLSAVDNDSVALSSVAASDAVVEKTPENGFESVAAVATAEVVHNPEVAVPEPGTFGLLMLGGTSMLGFFRRK